MTSKLDQILSALRLNPKVVLARTDEPRPCPEGNTHFECVEI